jgi:hypothetical protein
MTKRALRLLGLAVFLGGFSATLPGPGALAAQETHLVVISGLGGDPEYQEMFVDWGLTLMDAAAASGIPAENAIYLAEDPSVAPGRIQGRSTREDVQRVLEGIATGTPTDDRVLIVLIGHGSGEGEESRVALPGGPSLRATEYALLLERLAPRTVALVNVASASGDFIPVLAGEGRIVVTATRSSRQRNATLFGGYFADAFTGGKADADRDGRVSVLEAFEYARQETDRYYNDRGLIIPETALLEDRLDGEGVEAAGGDTGVGLLAQRFFLESVVPGDIEGDGPTAERLRELYLERARIEDEIAGLQQRQSTLEPDAYRAALEGLLVQLAEIGNEIRTLEGAP